MRRTDDCLWYNLIIFRIISAHAENRESSRAPYRLVQDHLRACGEQRRYAFRNLANVGSSPRMRRTADQADVSQRDIRIISAHAENRPHGTTTFRTSRDHLRACGEQHAPLGFAGNPMGSSPRMRRTAIHAYVNFGVGGSSPRMRRTASISRRDSLNTRIISAHAENSGACNANVLVCQDHLRACGEQSPIIVSGVDVEGSSPRMRRTDIAFGLAFRIWRIISAHAENSESGIPNYCGNRDHLRACGEQPGYLKIASGYDGSSPRMRRTGSRTDRSSPRDGIISAHAENRAVPVEALQAAWDHLRACGEQFPCSVASATFPGSSPRMRRTVR